MISIKNEIYEKLNNFELTNNLRFIIEKEKIPHTKNKNGTFINISLLEETHLLILNDFVKNVKNKKTDYLEEICPVQVEEKSFKKEIIKESEKKIKLDNLEQTIVAFSL
jgi:hypothetical protein